MANPLDCNGQPLPWSDRPCAPGDVDTPICYSVPPATDILPGVKRITINADCTASGSVILDQALAPVPGAVEVGCEAGCGFPCDAVGLCAALSALPVQVPAPADTAVYAGPGGCFLGVPIAGAVAFPLLAPNGSCAAPSYSFAASPDSGLFYDPAGVGSVVLGDDSCLDSITVGASIRIQTASITRLIFTNTGEWDIGGSVGVVGEVLTSNGAGVPPTWQAGGALACPLLASCDGACAAPAYSFASDAASGVWLGDPGDGNISVVVSFDNCGGYIAVSETQISGVSDQITFNATTNDVRISGGTEVRLETPGSTVRILVTGDWNIDGDVGALGEVLTSAGAGAPPVWTAQTVGSGGMVWAAANVGSAAETRIIPVGYDDALISAQTPKGYSSPRAGTFRNMYVRTNTANGNGASVTYTLRVNGVATLLSVTRATGAVGTSTNLVDTVAVAAGDLIEMMAIKPAGIGSGVQEVFVTAEFGA